MASPKASGRKSLTKSLWEEMQKRPKSCEFCEAKGLIPNPRRNSYEIDHIKPVSRGGDNSNDNLRWLCMYHNIARRNNQHKKHFSGEYSSKYFLNPLKREGGVM
jgi:hypothetical protein